MNVNLNSISLQQRKFSGTNSIGGIHLPDFNDKYVFSKKKSNTSNVEYKKQIAEQAYEDFKNGQFQNKSEGFNKLMKKYTSEVSPDRKGIITSGLKAVSRNKQSGLKPIDLLATILEGMLMCGKVTYKNLIDSRPLFRIFFGEIFSKALDYNVVIQDESYTYYNDILPLQKDAPLQKDDDWNSEVDSIEKIITHCSEEELKTAVLNMLEHLHEAHYNLNEYQIVILEISFSLARLYKKYQITSDKEFAGSKKMAVKILSLNTGEELDNWLINYFQLMRTLIQKKQVDNNVILAENAKKLVEEHFREPDLSVESICKELHVSSSYFSKIFKQETETTFLNYLISRRMEEAKMLLKMTDYKSHVIGTMVGYPEPNYFSYVFKKHCGISPVKYRKLGGENN